MSNRFLGTNRNDGKDVFASSLGAYSIQPGFPLIGNKRRRIKSSLLEVEHINGLQDALDEMGSGHMEGDLSVTGDLSAANALFNDTNGNMALGNITEIFSNGATENIAIGTSALDAQVSGDYCIGVGYDCLGKATGNNNIGIGLQCGQNLTSGNNNIGIGTNACAGNGGHSDSLTGDSNIGLGINAVRGGNNAGNPVSFNHNIGIGNSSLNNILTGTHNIGIGVDCGRNISSGSSNVLLGYKAGDDLTTESNRFRLESGTNLLMRGDFGTGLINIPGSLKVSQRTPASNTAAGSAGEISWDGNYIYVCTADNVWARVAIPTWT